MAGTGYTTTGAVTDFLPKAITKAALYIEFPTVMMGRVDNQSLSKGKGRTLNFPTGDQFQAYTTPEGVVASQVQRMSSTNVAITVSRVLAQAVLLDSTKDAAQDAMNTLFAKNLSNAIKRKIDKDLLNLAQSFSASFPGTGSTPVAGNLLAALTRIMSGGNSLTEPPPDGDFISGVLHPRQWHPIARNLSGLTSATVGTAANPIPAGVSQEILHAAWISNLYGIDLFRDGNILIDSNVDAKGAVWAKSAIKYVSYNEPKAKPFDIPGLDGQQIDYTTEYGVGTYRDAWGVTIYSAAANPSN